MNKKLKYYSHFIENPYYLDALEQQYIKTNFKKEWAKEDFKQHALFSTSTTGVALAAIGFIATTDLTAITIANLGLAAINLAIAFTDFPFAYQAYNDYNIQTLKVDLMEENNPDLKTKFDYKKSTTMTYDKERQK